MTAVAYSFFETNQRLAQMQFLAMAAAKKVRHRKKLDERNATARAKRAGAKNVGFVHDYPEIKASKVAEFEAKLKSCYGAMAVEFDTWEWHVSSNEFQTYRCFKDSAVRPVLAYGLEKIKASQLKPLLDLMSHRGIPLNFSNLVEALPKSALALTQAIQGAEGVTFSKDVTFELNTLRFLGRLSLALRYAYLKGAQFVGSKHIAIADLNHSSGKRARHDPKYRFSCLPERAQWQLMVPDYPYRAINGMELLGFKAKTFNRIFGAANSEFLAAHASKNNPNLTAIAGLQAAVYCLVHLLGDYEAVKRFVLSTQGDMSPTSLHNAGQFRLPAKGAKWTPSKWAPLMLRHPGATKYLTNIPKLEALGIFPESLTELRREYLKLSYPTPEKGFEPLYELCLRNELSADTYRQNVDYWRYAVVKPYDCMPNVHVRGEQLGLDNKWLMVKLQADDPHGPLLGELSGCCQHIAGMGKQSAQAGVTSPYSAFYVIFKGRRVYAQSWAWRTRNGEVVMDSWEGIFAEEHDIKVIARFVKAATQQMLSSSLGVNAVLIGDAYSGITHKLSQELGCKGTWYARKPIDPHGYFDGERQLLIAGKLKRTILHDEVKRGMLYKDLIKSSSLKTVENQRVNT